MLSSQRRLERRPRARSLFDRAIFVPRHRRFVREARSAVAGAQPGDVHRRSRRARRRSFFFVRDARASQRTRRVRFRDRGLALVHGALRQLCRGDGRRARQSASRLPAPHQDRDARAMLADDGSEERVTASTCAKATVVRVEAGELIPGRRRRRRRRRHRRRIGDHRRIGAGHPRSGRRPQRGHRRHARALRPHRRARHGEPGRNVPRSHDRARRRRAAPEDAQRDRAFDPARGLTIVFLIAVATLAPFSLYAGQASKRDRADRAARLPDSDDDRRAALGDRHRRHGSRHATQRARDERPRGRSRRRRRHALARQDRNDHARQPPSQSRSSLSTGVDSKRRRARRLSLVACRRNARRPLDRRARASRLGGASTATPQPARPSSRSARTRA